MMKRTVHWHEMFKDELEAAIAERPVCYLPYGLAEPHGLQSALGLDGLKAIGLLERAARAHGGVVAPPTWWHISETPESLAWLAGQNALQPFLTDVPPEVLYHQMVYQFRAVEAAGFRAAILVSGHAGSFTVDFRFIARTFEAHRPLRIRTLTDFDIAGEHWLSGGHAGQRETSLLWALRPDCVDLSRLPSEPIEGRLFASDEQARFSSRRGGEEILARQVEMLKRIADALLLEAESQPAGERVPFAETEAIWRAILAEREHWVADKPAEQLSQRRKERSQAYPLKLPAAPES